MLLLGANGAEMQCDALPLQFGRNSLRIGRNVLRTVVRAIYSDFFYSLTFVKGKVSNY